MTGLEGIQGVQAKVEIWGTCGDNFQPVRDAFTLNLETGQDIGSSVAVMVDGEVVVDLWGGHLDATYTRAWEKHTIAQSFSSTKTVSALCVLLLADRGELDLDAPVARYWPEFSAEDKGDIAIRQVLGHTSRLCGWDVPMTIRDLCDWEKSTTLLARRAPLWEPARTSGYHGYTHGHLLGEIVRRVTGRSIGRILADELAAPLGVESDYDIGVPEDADNRVSLLIQGTRTGRPNGNRFHDLSRAVDVRRGSRQGARATVRWRRPGDGYPLPVGHGLCTRDAAFSRGARRSARRVVGRRRRFAFVRRPRRSDVDRFRAEPLDLRTLRTAPQWQHRPGRLSGAQCDALN